ncbi:MAG: hypothetical protein IKS45_07485 [Thermoguttaceae bacterium]|nr:hypothetical protein [Thermoguttaceae bacterium]
MNLFSPQPTPYDLKFRLFGFPIRITPWFWVVAAMLGASFSPKTMVIWVVAVFLGILVHELGHAFAMRHYGFQPEITFHAMGGLTSYNPGYQINHRYLSNWEHVVIDAAGPLAGFALFGVIAVLLLFIGVNPIGFLFGDIDEQQRGSLFRFLSAPVIVFFHLEMYICLFWGILNLMPVYPLDGGQIAREICTAFNPRTGIVTSFQLSFVTALILAGIALVWLNDWFMAAFFGMFAYSSWQAMNNPYY